MFSFESVGKADLNAGKGERETEKNSRWRSCGRDIQKTSTKDGLMVYIWNTRNLGYHHSTCVIDIIEFNTHLNQRIDTILTKIN